MKRPRPHIVNAVVHRRPRILSEWTSGELDELGARPEEVHEALRVTTKWPDTKIEKVMELAAIAAITKRVTK